jgi:methylenetetrahydrofolate dehydrogenase (NADP+)/methenyltetrahydrofolate cyclohydrolase
VKVNGTEIAAKLYEDLKNRVDKLKKKKVVPHLVVFLIGENPASVAYVTLKQKKGEEIGAKVTILRYDTSITTKDLAEKVKLLNDDPFVHGILIQRPLPDQIDIDQLELLTNPEKDIDGFHPESPYVLPLPLAVVKILEEIYNTKKAEKDVNTKTQATFLAWLNSKNIVVIGKGPTGGGPVLEYLISLNVIPHIIDSKTINPDALMKAADIIISCVGKPNVIRHDQLKKGVILISVGIFRNEDNKLSGDYDAAEIEDVASYYTPTPGGVGPVNVAMLMENLVTAAEKQTSK